jgi:hypothetical protein
MASIYEAWRFKCGEHLNIEFGHFLANPVRITTRGPQTLRQIVAVHQEICDFAKTHHSPDENYHTQESYTEVIVVCDRDDNRPSMDRSVEEALKVESLREMALQQTVLIVRTTSSNVYLSPSSRRTPYRWIEPMLTV